MGDVDENGYLHTTSGKKVPRLEMSAAMFLDKTVNVYGPSGTGKTVIVKTIMKLVRGHIDQVIVVSPTESTNHSYDGIIPSPLIHPRPFLPDPSNPKKDDGVKGALRFLEAIWNRQMMMRAVYERANDVKVLSRLFGRLPGAVRREGFRAIDAIKNKRQGVVDTIRKQLAEDMGRRDEKIKEINEKFKTMLRLLYKKYITEHYAELYAREDLTEDELYSLSNLQFNPRLLLIFDDCAAELKGLFTKEIFRKFFYQGRWASLTTLVVAQDDTDIPTNIRKNAFISFYTNAVVCTTNFERKTNNFQKQTKEYVNDIVNDIYVGNRKMAYIREDPRMQNFYHITVPYPQPFKFGSGAFNELCEEVRSTGTVMDKDNPYYAMFAPK